MLFQRWVGLLTIGCTLVLLPQVSLADILAKRAPQGFESHSQTSEISTVASVHNNAYDGDFVMLYGRLVNFIGHEIYEFTDNTGRIEIELDDDHDWSHLARNEMICIKGIVDRDFFSTKIDVKVAFPLPKDEQKEVNVNTTPHL